MIFSRDYQNDFQNYGNIIKFYNKKTSKGFVQPFQKTFKTTTEKN